MINPYKIKKWAALLLAGIFPTIGFFVGVKFYGLWIGIACFAGTLFVSALLANLLLVNPFTSMLQGAGIMAIDMNSTGILQPFIVRLRNPDIIGRIRGRLIRDVFDRNAVMTLSEPVVASMQGKKDTKTGNISFTLSQEDFNRSRFAMYQYPVLIYNSHINSFLTKEWFSEMEKTAFAEHTVLYLNRIMQELTSMTRDFTRGVIDLLKPKGAGGNKWVWIIIIGGLILLAALFAPSVINAIKGASGSATEAVASGTANAGSTIVHATPTG